MESERQRTKLYSLKAFTGTVHGRALPYNEPDGRHGRTHRLDLDGFPESVRYDSTVYEPGAFESWIAKGGTSRARFLYNHGDPDIEGALKGVNALPIGTVRHVYEGPDGLYFEAEYASHDMAQSVRELIQSGGLNELSVSVEPLVSKFLKAPDGRSVFRYVSQANLFDISVVVWGQFGPKAAVT